MKVRYIRESMNGSNSNTGCHWCEIQAINYESTNIALNKKVTCEGGSYEKGTLDMITNGNTSVDDYIYFRNDPQKTVSVIVDLGNIEDIDNIKVWHYHGGGRIYKNILLEISLDGVKWTKIFDSNENGEYAETEEGKTHKLIDDRLTSLSEIASLSEIVSFYEKYVKKNLLDKEVLVNILNSKGLDVSTEDKMLNLISRTNDLNSFVYDVGENYILYNDENIEKTTSNSYIYFNKEYKFINDGNYRLSASFQCIGSIGVPKIKLLILNEDTVFTEKEFTGSNDSLINATLDVLNVKKGYIFKIMGLNSFGRETQLIKAKVTCDLKIL